MARLSPSPGSGPRRRRGGRHRSLLAALVLTVTLCGTPTTRAQTTLSLEITAAEGFAAEARALGGRSAERHQTLARFVGLEEPGPAIAVQLVDEAHPVARQTAHWISGFAVPDRDLTVLFPARVPVYPHDSLQELLDHELLHIFLHRSVGGRPVPRWFSEGVALVGSRGLSLTDRGQALVGGVRGGPRDVASLERYFRTDRRGSHTAYALSGAFVHHLTQRHGAGWIGDLTRAMRTGASFDVALEIALSEPIEVAEGRFFRRSRLLYTWLPWLSSGAGLWVLVTALALVAGRRNRRRTAAIEARWEAEERRREALAAAAQELHERTEREGRSDPGDEPPQHWVH